MLQFSKSLLVLSLVLISDLAFAQIQDSLVQDSLFKEILVQDTTGEDMFVEEIIKDDTIIPSEAIDAKKVKTKKTSIFSGKPGKSMLFSLVIPGSGQIYNKSYLRVPVVYGVIGGAGYYLHTSSVIYRCYSDAYVAAVDGVPYVKPTKCKILENIENITDPGTLRERRDEANSRRQFAIVLFAIAWLANGIDAYVDAHLKSFDMDESLSFDFGPIMDEDPAAPFRMGLMVKF